MLVAALLTALCLAWAASAEAAVYKGEGRDDPKTKLRMVAGEKAVGFFKARSIKIQFDDKDRTKVRATNTDKQNMMKLPLELRPNGRRRFVQHFTGENENKTKIEIDIVGSLNGSLTRARGWFEVRLVLGPDEDLPEATIGTTGRVRFLVKQR